MSQRRKRLASELGPFMQQYGRQSKDMNDRGYDRRLEEKIKSIDPVELDELLHGDIEEDRDFPEGVTTPRASSP